MRSSGQPNGALSDKEGRWVLVASAWCKLAVLCREACKSIAMLAHDIC